MEKLRDMGKATGEWNSSPWGHHTASNTEESRGIRNKSRKENLLEEIMSLKKKKGLSLKYSAKIEKEGTTPNLTMMKGR